MAFCPLLSRRLFLYCGLSEKRSLASMEFCLQYLKWPLKKKICCTGIFPVWHPVFLIHPRSWHMLAPANGARIHLDDKIRRTKERNVQGIKLIVNRRISERGRDFTGRNQVSVVGAVGILAAARQKSAVPRWRPHDSKEQEVSSNARQIVSDRSKETITTGRGKQMPSFVFINARRMIYFSGETHSVISESRSITVTFYTHDN